MRGRGEESNVTNEYIFELIVIKNMSNHVSPNFLNFGSHWGLRRGEEEEGRIEKISEYLNSAPSIM